MFTKYTSNIVYNGFKYNYSVGLFKPILDTMTTTSTSSTLTGPIITKRYLLMNRYHQQPIKDPKRQQLEELVVKEVEKKREDQMFGGTRPRRVVRNYNITPPNLVDLNSTLNQPRKIEGSKRLNVAVIGAPNAGKSSLVNRLIGEKVCAVSSREHTTRDNIVGVFTEDKTQLVFNDTPGIIKNFEKQSKIKEFVNMAWGVVKEADVVLLVVDASSNVQQQDSNFINQDDNSNRQRNNGYPDKVYTTPSSSLTATDTSHIVSILEYEMLELLKEMKQYQKDNLDKDFILVINKVDLIKRKDDLLALVSRLNEGSIFTDTFITSATESIHLDTLKKYLMERAVPGDWEFSDDLKTDQTEIFRASEIIKEKVYERMRQEIPYTIQQNMVGWTNFKNGDLRIDHDFIVKKDSHKSAMLGKNGQTIKAIYLEAKKDLEKVFNRRVHLFLTVKVKKNALSEEEEIND